MNKKIIAITMGDPAGIGPEIILKTLSNKSIYDLCKPVVIGNISVLKRYQRVIGTTLTFNEISEPENGLYNFGTIDVITISDYEKIEFEIGTVNGTCGKAAFLYIEKAIELSLNNKIDAVSTGPVNKESFKEGNVNYIGHTEIFADLTNTPSPLTMFQTGNLRVFFLSRHKSLRQACDYVTKDNLVLSIRQCIIEMKKIGLTGILGVAGLNPHCGENGLFGYEETNEIIPAISQTKLEGFNVYGPVGADSIFHQAIEGKYDAVLSLYHDQGHIATKTYDFHKTISLTLGLPFLRVSVDHGTAFDIAGKGIASDVSLIESIKTAVNYLK